MLHIYFEFLGSAGSVNLIWKWTHTAAAFFIFTNFALCTPTLIFSEPGVMYHHLCSCRCGSLHWDGVQDGPQLQVQVPEAFCGGEVRFFPPCPSVRTEIILWYRNAEFCILSPGPWIPSSSSTWPSCCLRPSSALSWSTPGKRRTSGTNLSTTKRLNRRETAARSVEWSHPGLFNAERYSWGNWTSPAVQKPVQWPQPLYNNYDVFLWLFKHFEG